MNNWGWQIQQKFINKTIVELLNLKYKKFDSLKEKIILNNKKIDIFFNYNLKKGDQIFILDKEIKLIDFLKPNVSKIIHETNNFLIVYKGFGIVTHPDASHKNNTLLNLVFEKLNFKNKNEILEKNLGIIHRLDKPTTGLLIIARNEKFFKILKELMLKRKIKRSYISIVEGVPKNNFFTISAPLIKPGKNKRSKISFFGNNAITHVELLKKINKFLSLLKIQLETGRTHQIRSHLKYVNLPILNDRLYNKGNTLYIFLHAFELKFELLNNKKFNITFSKPIYFKEIEFK